MNTKGLDDSPALKFYEDHTAQIEVLPSFLKCLLYMCV